MLLKQQTDNQLEKTKSDYCDTFYKNQNGLIIKESNLIEIPEYNLIFEPEIIKRKRHIMMKEEINVAVAFLIRIISGSNSQLTKLQTDELQSNITQLLTNKFHNHWHPDKPTKGQAFRCIRVNSKSRNDSILESACQSTGISFEELSLPIELTLWIDPQEVSCRFGEHKGSYCLLAKFKDNNKENFVDKINISEMDKLVIERSKQRAYEIINSRKKKYNKNGFNKNNNTTLTSVHINNNNTNAYDIPTTTNSAANYYQQYYASSPNTKYYSSSPPQMQQQQPQQTNNNGLYSPNRMSPYRNNPTTSYMNVSKSMIRNLTRTSFDSIGSAALTHNPSDRFHWMNKSVKA